MYDLLNDNYPDKDRDIREVSSTLDYLDSVITFEPTLSNILKKNTHFYTIFTLANHLKTSKFSPEAFSKKLKSWYEWYESTAIPDENYAKAVEEYRKASHEGVQKKANRFMRYEILLTYIEN
jgi:hypothetical protein